MQQYPITGALANPCPDTGKERALGVLLAVQAFCRACNPVVNHGSLLGLQNCTTQVSFGDLEEGERAGKFPPGWCLALATAFLHSTVN